MSKLDVSLESSRPQRAAILPLMWDYVSPVLPWIGYLLLLVLIVAGLFINILGLPGLWLIVLGVIGYAWGTGFEYIGWWTIGIVIVLGLLAELVEFFAGAAGSAQAGGSKRGMAGAIIGGIVGGIVGTPILPIVGTIIGSIIGCALGAYLIETSIGKGHTESMNISIGAAKGRAVGLIAKTAFGITMGLIAAIVGLPIHLGDDAQIIATPSTLPTTLPVEPTPAAVPLEPTTLPVEATTLPVEPTTTPAVQP